MNINSQFHRVADTDVLLQN